jgi:hypothetical protein
MTQSNSLSAMYFKWKLPTQHDSVAFVPTSQRFVSSNSDSSTPPLWQPLSLHHSNTLTPASLRYGCQLPNYLAMPPLPTRPPHSNKPPAGRSFVAASVHSCHRSSSPYLGSSYADGLPITASLAGSQITGKSVCRRRRGVHKP